MSPKQTGGGGGGRCCELLLARQERGKNAQVQKSYYTWPPDPLSIQRPVRGLREALKDSCIWELGEDAKGGKYLW